MDVSNQFIQQLFSHPHFSKQFSIFWSSFTFEASQVSNIKPHAESTPIHAVVDQISQLLQNNFKTAVELQCSHLYESNRYLLEEIEHLKAHLKPSNLKTQSSTAQRDTNPKLQTSIFFQTDSQFDMKQIRKQFDDSIIENKILTNSFDDQIGQQDKTYQEIEDKINASLQGSINRIELTLEEKFEKYSAKIEGMIEQLRKTIASVVQAMNEKDYWAQETTKRQNNQNRHMGTNAFVKKQSKPEQNKKQDAYNTKKQLLTKQHEQGNPQKAKQIVRPSPQVHPNSNKTIETLNKSISMGRTKIKSLFGFKSSTCTKQINQECQKM